MAVLTAPPAPAGFSVAYRQLQAAQKTSKGAPAYTLYVNRRLGRILAAAAFQVNLTPNQVTGISAVCTFAGIAVVAGAPRGWATGILAALLLALGYALDSADGQLARLRGGGSLSGEWLDHMVDCLKLATIHLAVLVGFYRTPDLDRAWCLVPLAFSATASVKFFGKILNDQLLRLRRSPTEAVELAPIGWGKLLLAAPTDYGVLAVSFVLWGSRTGFLIAYAVMFAANLAFLLTGVARWYAEMRRLDLQPG
jgi:phosphatidylglycerophosphate synthase